ncbi:MAG: M23 family metallopeptidase [Oscillospiraceae bacterium]|jgi:murein DD-endopeptidase MepM/ murein hydrolase activator NlpD|nr:M23 family metallopeptidase [Oscillospiraceae bacterium]
MKKLQKIFSRVSGAYFKITDRHGLVITIFVCVAIVVGSGLWANLNTSAPESVQTGDTAGFVDRLSDVIVQSTFPPMATAAPTPQPKWAKMAQGEIIRDFSSAPVYMKTIDGYGIHAAIDIAALKGENVVTPYDGTIRSIEQSAKYGWVVSIELEGGSLVSVAGLSSPSAAVGAAVKKGQTIGTAGGSIPCESLDAPHIHIEWVADGTAADISGKWR